jgi:hypothetical protein
LNHRDSAPESVSLPVFFGSATSEVVPLKEAAVEEEPVSGPAAPSVTFSYVAFLVPSLARTASLAVVPELSVSGHAPLGSRSREAFWYCEPVV